MRSFVSFFLGPLNCCNLVVNVYDMAPMANQRPVCMPITLASWWMDAPTDRPSDPSNVWWEKQNVNQQVYDNTERSNRRFTLPLFKSSPSLIKFLLTWLDSGETLLRTMITFSIHALVSHRHSRHSMEKLVSPCRWWCSKTTVLWLNYLMLLCQPVAPNLFVFFFFVFFLDMKLGTFQIFENECTIHPSY